MYRVSFLICCVSFIGIAWPVSAQPSQVTFAFYCTSLLDSCSENGQPPFGDPLLLPDGELIHIRWDSDENGQDIFDPLISVCPPEDPPPCANFNQLPYNPPPPPCEVEINNLIVTGQPHLYIEIRLTWQWHLVSPVYAILPGENNFFIETWYCMTCEEGVPPAPENLTATDDLCGAIRLTWTYPAGWDSLPLGFEIVRNDRVLGRTTNPHAREWGDGVFDRSQYTYTVNAWYFGGPICYSTGVSVQGQGGGPTPCENVTASDGVPETVTVEWDFSGDPGVSSFWVHRDSTFIGGVYFMGGQPGHYAHTDSLPPPEIHWYTVVAHSDFCGDTVALGDSGWAATSGAEGHPVAIPEKVALISCYPNPFNAGATIRYSLPREMRAQLSVYDITGRKIAVLAEGMIQSGEHQAQFDGAKLTSGVLLVRLTAGDVESVMKIVLLK